MYLIEKIKSLQIKIISIFAVLIIALAFVDCSGNSSTTGTGGTIGSGTLGARGSTIVTSPPHDDTCVTTGCAATKPHPGVGHPTLNQGSPAANDSAARSGNQWACINCHGNNLQGSTYTASGQNTFLDSYLISGFNAWPVAPPACTSCHGFPQ